MAFKPKKPLSRRDFLKAAAVSATAALVQVNGGMVAAMPHRSVTTSSAKQGGFNESPMLRARVEAGVLPPVEERLPPNPQVITPIEEVGIYGGVGRVLTANPNALHGDPQAIMGTELVLRIASDFSSITGGLVERWEFNSELTEQTLYLRQGLKWSDGQPFTTSDFIFAWEDCQMNSELRPAGPNNDWRIGAERTPMMMEAVDDYTLKLSFVEPHPLIILSEGFYAGSQWGGIEGLFAPRHYGEQFHPSYTDPEAVNAMSQEAGFETWIQHFTDRMRVQSTLPAQIDLPAMTAYIRIDDAPDRHVYERNPYYWKVDTAGNQLPYIDTVDVAVISEQETQTARLIAGNIDLFGNFSTLSNLPLYQQNEESANIRTLLWRSTTPGYAIFYPNLTVQNPELRAFFQNKDVRHALSLGLDRDEINTLVHFGLGEPRQWAMWPNSKYYREGDERHWADFDRDQANALLDAAGYAERDGDGFRLYPNGERISWVLQFDTSVPDMGPTFELARDYWAELGLDMSLRSISRALLDELIAANDIDMATWLGDISDITWPNFPRVMLPGVTNAKWGRAWELWLLQRGTNELEEEPPDEVKAQHERWVAMRAAATDEEHIRIAREMWDWYYDYLPAFATVGTPKPVVLKQNLGNFPAEGIWGFAAIRTIPVNPEQFFFRPV